MLQQGRAPKPPSRRTTAKLRSSGGRRRRGFCVARQFFFRAVALRSAGSGDGRDPAGSLRVELVLRTRLLESRQFRARGIDGDDLWKPLERYLQTARVVDLRHETEVGERDLAAECVRRGLHQRLQRVEALGDPMVIPG